VVNCYGARSLQERGRNRLCSRRWRVESHMTSGPCS
jgi:hypothetical protein